MLGCECLCIPVISALQMCIRHAHMRELMFKLFLQIHNSKHTLTHSHRVGASDADERKPLRHEQSPTDTHTQKQANDKIRKAHSRSR